MNTGKIENGLALIGVLIVLFGVTFAASTALADGADNPGPTLNYALQTTD